MRAEWPWLLIVCVHAAETLERKKGCPGSLCPCLSSLRPVLLLHSSSSAFHRALNTSFFLVITSCLISVAFALCSRHSTCARAVTRPCQGCLPEVVAAMLKMCPVRTCFPVNFSCMYLGKNARQDICSEQLSALKVFTLSASPILNSVAMLTMPPISLK